MSKQTDQYELSRIVAQQTGLDQHIAEAFVGQLFREIEKSLIVDSHIKVDGLGLFRIIKSGDSQRILFLGSNTPMGQSVDQSQTDTKKTLDQTPESNIATTLTSTKEESVQTGSKSGSVVEKNVPEPNKVEPFDRRTAPEVRKVASDGDRPTSFEKASNADTPIRRVTTESVKSGISVEEATAEPEKVEPIMRRVQPEPEKSSSAVEKTTTEPEKSEPTLVKRISPELTRNASVVETTTEVNKPTTNTSTPERKLAESFDTDDADAVVIRNFHNSIRNQAQRIEEPEIINENKSSLVKTFIIALVILAILGIVYVVAIGSTLKPKDKIHQTIAFKELKNVDSLNYNCIVVPESNVSLQYLSKIYYGNDIYWPYIYHANKDKVNKLLVIGAGSVTKIPRISVDLISLNNGEVAFIAKTLGDQIIKEIR